jgi:TrmH family RNA methyltransferase
VLRAGQGAHFGLRIREQVDLVALLQASPGATSVAAIAGPAVSLYDLDLTGPTLWLFGNEGAGLSHAVQANAQCRATIPMAAGCESLNVASAAAVFLFEACRQRALNEVEVKSPLSSNLPTKTHDP